jgi:hypothetical protein
MSEFAIFFDPVLNIVTGTVIMDQGVNDSDANHRIALRRQWNSRDKVIFVPRHLSADTDIILSQLGISRLA